MNVRESGGGCISIKICCLLIKFLSYIEFAHYTTTAR